MGLGHNRNTKIFLWFYMCDHYMGLNVDKSDKVYF